MLRVEENVGTALTRQEEADLLEACFASRSRTLYPAVLLALNTGMRSIEIRSLRGAGRLCGQTGPRWSQQD